MRLSLLLCSLLIPCAVVITGITGCAKSGTKDSNGATTSTTTTTTITTTAPQNKDRSVMVSLVGNTSFTPTQQQYCIDLQNRLSEGWRPLKSDRRYSVAVEFLITRPGYCSDVHPVSATGGQRAIERTVDSVKMCGPFGPLPDSFQEAPAQFRCDFLYKPESAQTTK
jgi:hypothetical protein